MRKMSFHVIEIVSSKSMSRQGQKVE